MSVAETWRANKEAIPEAQKFDWTYSTPYRGGATKCAAPWLPEPTEQKIDFESLKVRCAFCLCVCMCVCARVCAVLNFLLVCRMGSNVQEKTFCGRQT